MKKAIRNVVKAIAVLILTSTLVGCGTSANSNQVTSYGTVDWSSASLGYVAFTAKGQKCCFILQGPNGAQTFMTVQKGETVYPLLADGTGRYHYAIANTNEDGKTYTIKYKNSFTYHGKETLS